MVEGDFSTNGNYFHHYQPVYNIESWNIIGFEGLVRTKEFYDPNRIFKKAKLQKKLFELDSGSILKASQTYINAGYHERYKNLFLNVFASTITNPLFYTFVNKIIDESPITSQQIILEINESEIYKPETLKEDIRLLKKMGIRIAIDDYGKGFSNFKTLIELQPDIIKLDKYFIEGIKDYEQKKKAISFISSYCQQSNIQLIVEGVEDSISLAILKSMGIKFAQGYLLGKPGLLQ